MTLLPNDLKTENIRICFFPGRERSYYRTRVILKSLQENNFQVHDCSQNKKGALRYFLGFLKFLSHKNQSDIIWIGFCGHLLVPLVRIFTRKKIIFEALISIYQTLCFDRKVASPTGIVAHLARFIDRLSCRLADKILLDTNQHIDYFVNTFRIERSKFARLWVGSDDSVMFPRPASLNSNFLVHFHGEFQPLHGAEYIVEAASLLPDIHFQMIGKGRDLDLCLEKAKKLNLQNVKFIPPVSYAQLTDYMAKAAVCLGIFGNTPKTQLVIPHKVYEALAMKKPVITADTPAMHELLTDGENVILCNAADPKSL